MFFDFFLRFFDFYFAQIVTFLLQVIIGYGTTNQQQKNEQKTNHTISKKNTSGANTCVPVHLSVLQARFYVFSVFFLHANTTVLYLYHYIYIFRLLTI